MRFNLNNVTLLSLLISAAVSGCGGGGGTSSSTAIRGTAASGSGLVGVVQIKDSASPAHTANTNTDANGNYSFTTAQLAGMHGPYMLEIDYKIGGVDYYLTSAATAQDLSNGPRTINITPLTDLVVSNLAHEIASNVFKNGNYGSILTPATLSAGAAALAAQLQPLLTALGITGTVDLLHDSFTSNSHTGLDAVLDALKVTIDPATNTALITNRLNDTSITDNLTVNATANTATISSSGTIPLTDLQAITAGFKAFSAKMSNAPLDSDLGLLAFFNQTNFLQDGKSLSLFLQEITTNPTVVGGSLSFSDIILDAIPAWVTAVPVGATAYKVKFSVMKNNTPNSREEMIIYKSASGSWLLLGNQHIVKARMDDLETFGYNGSGSAYCTGLQPQVGIRGGSTHISYAVVTGPGLPNAGLLLFNPGANSNNTDFYIAAGDVTTYNGTSTVQLASNTTNCGYSSLYPLADSAITSVSAPVVAGSRYSINLYDDNSTPADRSDDVKLATYESMLSSVPLLNTQLNATLFPTVTANYQGQLTTVIADANAATVQTFVANWTAPASSGLYASNAWLEIWSQTNSNTVSADLPWDATSASLAIPLFTNGTGPAIHASATLEYVDAGFRLYWASYNK